MAERVLVVKHVPWEGPHRIGAALISAEVELDVRCTLDGDALPAVDDVIGAVFMGGPMNVDEVDDYPGLLIEREWIAAAVEAGLPVLGVCLGAQLLATAHNGTVAPAAAGPEIGPHLVAKRDVAERDPLFAPLPMLPDVIQWHYDEITELPLSAVLLATSTNYANQAFRLGESAWGVQFHPEVDTAMFGEWLATNDPLMARLGTTAPDMLAAVAVLADDLFEVWQPVLARFAALALGDLPRGKPEPVGPAIGRELPLLGH